MLLRSPPVEKLARNKTKPINKQKPLRGLRKGPWVPELGVWNSKRLGDKTAYETASRREKNVIVILLL